MCKKYINTFLMVTGLILCLSGCAKKNISNYETEKPGNHAGNGSVLETGDKNILQEESDACGSEYAQEIYGEKEGFSKVKMGLTVNGEKQEYCEIIVPESFRFLPGFVGQDREHFGDERPSFESVKSNDMRYEIVRGEKTLSEIIREYNLDDLDLSISKIYMRPMGRDQNDNTSFTLGVWEEDLSEYAVPFDAYSESTLFGTDENPAYFFQYEKGNVFVAYQLMDGLILTMYYEGPLTEEIGAEKIARDLYELVEPMDTDYKSDNTPNEVLAGVYPDGGTLEILALGLTDDMENPQIYCNVLIPSTYTIDVMCMSEDGVMVDASADNYEGSGFDLYGWSTVSEYIGKGIPDALTTPISLINLYSEGNRNKISVFISGNSNPSPDDVETKELKIEDDTVKYYSYEEYNGSKTLVVVRKIKDKELCFSYTGQMVEDCDSEQLAKNIYALIDAAERN